MAAVYTQIDDQLWDQMVALPLFGEPGLAANGVQVANATYNPSVDGILWNVALWARLKPAPDHQPFLTSRRRGAAARDTPVGALPCPSPRWHHRSHFVGVAE